MHSATKRPRSMIFVRGDMAVTNIAVVCIGVLIYFISFSTAVKTHNVWITKVDKSEMDPEYMDSFEVNLKKISKRVKALTMNFNLKQDIGPEYICEVKLFQKSNGNYVKAPIDVPKSSCCEFLESNTLIWPCIQSHSNIPQKCPILKGTYWIKDYNPDTCNYTENLPPKLPEEYKTDLHVSHGAKQMFHQSFYSTLKRIMKFL